jgi:hypothetical protein
MKRKLAVLTAVTALALPMTATPAQAAGPSVKCQVDTVAPYEYKIDWIKAIVDVSCWNHPGLVMARARLFEVVPAHRSGNRNIPSQLKAVGPWTEAKGERAADIYPIGLCSGGSRAQYLAYWEVIAWPHRLMEDQYDGWTKAGATSIKEINCSDRRFGSRGPEHAETQTPNRGINNNRPGGAWLIPPQKLPPDCDMAIFNRCLW